VYPPAGYLIFKHVSRRHTSLKIRQTRIAGDILLKFNLLSIHNQEN